MNKDEKPELSGEAWTDHLLRREAVRRVSTQGTGGSPSALESVLAAISSEAAERLDRAKASK
jgi:hypothetical protein